VLTPGSGFEWTARAGGVLSGFDRYADGRVEMRWKLFGLLPVMRAAGPDVTRSAAGRAAAETIWLPTTLLPPRHRVPHGLHQRPGTRFRLAECRSSEGRYVKGRATRARVER
jgi:hypothetical protein